MDNISTLIFGGLVVLMTHFVLKRHLRYSKLGYPVATTSIPVVGAAIAFGSRGLEFLREKHKQLGNVFVVDLLVLRFHFVLGPKAIQAFYKAPNDVSQIFVSQQKRCLSK